MTPEVRAGDWLIRSGATVTLVGMLLTAVAVLPLLTGTPMPSVLWALAMTTGVGFAMVLAGLWRNARARSRLQTAATAQTHR